MADRLAIHMKGLREIDWEATPTRAAGKPNEYIEFLAKETTQLHKILSKYLPDAVVDVSGDLASSSWLQC
jgi:vacuolar protein sorting-associated protein 54